MQIFKKHDVDKALTIICENPYLNMINKKKDHSVLCFNSDTCPKFEPVDSIDDERRNSMVKCKYSKINPLNDTYICTKPGAKYTACFWDDQLLCPAAEFEEDIPENDHVNHPNHYCQGGIECIKAIEASMPPDGFQDYCKGNVLKYIWRWRDKAGVEDLKKARVYLNWLIESAEKEKTE